MAVVVDTSAWIEFFKPRGSEQIKRAIVAALEEGIVVTTAPILTELLVGMNPGRANDARAIKRLRALDTAALDWDACDRAGAFGRALMRRGRRVPTVDLLIAGAAAAAGHEVWHIGDEHFVWMERVGGPPQRDLAQGG